MTPVRIALGADHAGYPLKVDVARHLADRGYEVLDLGTHSEDPVDYPHLCAAVGRAVVTRAADVGIVLGGSGQGEQIAANKVHGVRAALCLDHFTARLAREHNDANVLSLGGRILAPAIACSIVDTFLGARFEGGRHRRRVDQIAEIEREECRDGLPRRTASATDRELRKEEA
jgi:ribose 5-phosphate isomerase B